jgi:two-component system, chemotaxis family, sensor kinase CheA
MSSQEFLQDYIEEVQEHLMDMEKSLLILEQEGADQEQIAQIFRAAHSIKGASTYMGFEGLATLTHELESLIAGIQHNAGSVPSSGISIMLRCVDLISGAVEHVKKEGSEPPLDTSFLENLRNAFSGEGIEGLLEDTLKRTGFRSEDTGSPLLYPEAPDFAADYADIAETPLSLTDEQEFQRTIQEEDEELLAIFISSVRENYSKLRDHLTSSEKFTLDEGDNRAARELIQKMIASAQYMDYQQIIARLSELEQIFVVELDGGETLRQEILEQFESTGRDLDRMVPGLGISIPVKSADAPSGSAIQEEDQELFSIFLSSFQQNFSTLAQAVLSSAPSEVRFEKASELTGSMIRSSQYMDYDQIVELLIGWKESLSVFREQDDGNLEDLLSILGKELQAILPGFQIPEFSKDKPGASCFDSLEEEMDLVFDMAARPVETESLFGESDPPGDLPADDIPETFEKEEIKGMAPPPGQPESKIPVQPEQPKDSGRNAAGKDRTVLVAEDVSHNTVTLRVDAQKVDQLLNQVGELVVNRSEFVQTAMLFRDVLRDLSTQSGLPKNELRRLRLLNFRLNESTQSLGRVANDLQASVMRVRMLPILQLFQRFPRIARDQALKLGKKVDLILEGGDTEIDKRVLEQMNDPLVQFLRNAIAHGLEKPEERRLAGKPETGSIRLAAYHSGDYVTIEVEDDGRGVDTQKLRELLRARNELSRHEVDKLSDQEITYAMFMPGISTYDRVDGAAGRGVGLDVVKENVEHMNGSIEVESYPGQGTRFIVRIPLTVAIIRALLVKEAGQIFTIPLTSVTEILRYRPEDSHSIEGFRVITLRGKTIPLVDLHRLLKMGLSQSENRHRFVVIVSTSFREVGLVVDGLMGEREVVIKSIENGFHAVEGFSGATILGDGRVSLIVDVSALLRMMKNTPTGTRQPANTTLH